MTVMLSFRADEEDVAEADRWASRLGVERSQLLREALTSHLARLAAESDAGAYATQPVTPEETSLDGADDWGPAEDWADWANGRMGGTVQRGEIWFAEVPAGGDRPVLVLTRGPVADRIERVVVAALTRTRRGVVSELALTVAEDDVPSDCVVSFDNLHTLPRLAFRRRITSLSVQRMARACVSLRAALAC
ncbi:MAG TPA: type II toxin-antitoxin system PemK/MazF family toxin [Acidimicrobiales bacterium]|nr:type II toxin-antitoxin system PemK/MazF family toxin [Acidimicrobiales bacterium]